MNRLTERSKNGEVCIILDKTDKTKDKVIELCNRLCALEDAIERIEQTFDEHLIWDDDDLGYGNALKYCLKELGVE